MTLTRETRDLIRFIRDSIVRETLPADLRAGRVYRLDGSDNPAQGAWRGLIPATETRVTARGMHGDKTVKVGSHASRVSIRDAHKPPETLLPLHVCGVATHPEATDQDYVSLIETVRRQPSLATLRRMMPGPHGYSTLPMLNTVLPVSLYRDARDERKRDRVSKPRVMGNAVLPEVLRMVETVGNIGNVV